MRLLCLIPTITRISGLSTWISILLICTCNLQIIMHLIFHNGVKVICYRRKSWEGWLTTVDTSDAVMKHGGNNNGRDTHQEREIVFSAREGKDRSDVREPHMKKPKWKGHSSRVDINSPWIELRRVLQFLRTR